MGDAMTKDVPVETTDAPALHKRLDQYIQVRDKIEALKEKHKAELEPLNKALLMLNGKLLELLTEQGSDSVTVREVGTVYRTIKKSATIADGDLFRTFVINGEQWGLVDWRANPVGVQAHIETNDGHAPPGVNFRQVAVVGVRRASDR